MKLFKALQHIIIPGCTGNFFENCGSSAPGQAGVH